MNKLYISLISVFIKDYQEESWAIAQTIKSAKRDVKNRLDDLAKAKLLPIMNKLFTDGISTSNRIVKADVSKLADQLNLPFKYNKDLLESINGDSIFTGFYDKNYRELYTKREIDAVKRKILAAKYQGLTDKEMADSIRSVINTTKERALMTARLETQRLEGAAIDIYYNQPKVKKAYNKVYHYADSESREAHKYSARFDAGNGPGVADDDGNFTTESGGKFSSAPNPISPYNCRCWVSLELKQ
jgi:hypothetical protein